MFELLEERSHIPTLHLLQWAPCKSTMRSINLKVIAEICANLVSINLSISIKINKKKIQIPNISTHPNMERNPAKKYKRMHSCREIIWLSYRLRNPCHLQLSLWPGQSTCKPSTTAHRCTVLDNYPAYLGRNYILRSNINSKSIAHRRL